MRCGSQLSLNLRLCFDLIFFPSLITAPEISQGIYGEGHRFGDNNILLFSAISMKVSAVTIFIYSSFSHSQRGTMCLG